MSPFEVVYGFNPLTPLDLSPLPLSSIVCVDGAHKAEMVKKTHEKVKAQIEKKNQGYARIANKGRVHLSFEPGDWVWLHLRKERFPQARKSKLAPRGDGPFQVVRKIGENAYTLDLPHDKYNVHATFNVGDLSPYVGLEELDEEEGEQGEDPRTDPFQEGGDDEGIPDHGAWSKDVVPSHSAWSNSASPGHGASARQHSATPSTEAESFSTPRASTPTGARKGPKTRSQHTARPTPPTRPVSSPSPENQALAPLAGLGGPMTRGRARRAQALLFNMVQGWITLEAAQGKVPSPTEQLREGYGVLRTPCTPPLALSCSTVYETNGALSPTTFPALTAIPGVPSPHSNSHKPLLAEGINE